jgi:type II pantothenate kinase
MFTPVGPHPDRDWRAWVPRPQGRRFAPCPRPPELPGLWDLGRRPDVVPHWAGIFRANARYLLEVVSEDGERDARARGRQAVEVFEGLLRDLESGAATRELRTVHDVTLVREHLLRGHGIPDPYRAVKAAEASRFLPRAHAALVRAWELGGADGSRDALTEILADLLAGNLFDLGSRLTQEAFRRGEMDIPGAARGFRGAVAGALARWDPAALERLAPRPVALEHRPEGRVLLFADNAGGDFLLGVLPAAVFWARRWEVVVVVNSLPASSDIAIAEARAHWALLGAWPGSPLGRLVDAGRLRLVESGTGAPGIDFRFVGPELNAAAAGVAWVALEGQGRAVETNWSTRFSCPALRVAVVKDARVAEQIGWREGAPLVRWDEPGEGAADPGRTDP